MVGSTLIMRMIERFPVIVWAGAALLGWIAGEMIIHDPYLVAQFAIGPDSKLPYLAAAVGAVFVVTVAWLLKARSRPADA